MAKERQTKCDISGVQTQYRVVIILTIAAEQRQYQGYRPAERVRQMIDPDVDQSSRLQPLFRCALSAQVIIAQFS